MTIKLLYKKNTIHSDYYETALLGTLHPDYYQTDLLGTLSSLKTIKLFHKKHYPLW